MEGPGSCRQLPGAVAAAAWAQRHLPPPSAGEVG